MKLSLRGRLLLAAVSLVAVGLIAAEAATYTVLRSSLIGRLDEQLLGSREDAARQLDFAGDVFGRPPHRENTSVRYVGLLDAEGKLVVEDTIGFPGTPDVAFRFPSDLPGSTTSKEIRPQSFNARAIGTGSRYRLVASAVRGGGTFIVAAPLADVEATLGRLLFIEGIVTVVVLGAVGGLAFWLVRVGLRPLTHMEEAAAEIAGGNLSRRVSPAEAQTEVGRLGLALNAMLEKIEAAFAERRASEAKLRRFVADASHELRTPLTSIRGYAELFRRAKPEDVEKSMRRIEEESARMGELVEELLLLARLDQGRPLERGPVDLTQIVNDAVGDARAVQADRPIDIVAPEGVVVEGDEARLRQVAANLLSNALEHTPAGTPVHVRLRTDDGEAALEVADEGPGLAPEDADKVFDRFFRVDPARGRDNGGAGLGLSIVAAIAHAHGGSVALLTSPGNGARFIVTVPLVARERVTETAQ